MKTIGLLVLLTAIAFPAATGDIERQSVADAQAPVTTNDDASDRAGSAQTGIRIWKPVTIRSPGRYVVVRNISAPGPVIHIQSSDVEVDLGGFVLENVSEKGSVIQAFPQVIENVTVENGTVRGGVSCIFVDRVTQLVLRNLATADCKNGIFLDDNTAATVEHNRVQASEKGIAVDDCDNCRIADNVVVGGLDFGIRVEIGDGGEISANRVTFSKSCLDIGGEGVVIRDNTVATCDDGITVRAENGLIEGNVVSRCETGLTFGPFSEANLYRGNVARGNDVGIQDDGTGNTSAGDNYLPDLR